MVQIDALGFDAEQRRYCRASQRCDDQAVKQQRVPMVTSRAGTTAVANIQRQASRFGTTTTPIAYGGWRFSVFSGRAFRRFQFLNHWARSDIPDFSCVLGDSAVARKFTGTGNVQHGCPMPGGRVTVEFAQPRMGIAV